MLIKVRCMWFFFHLFPKCVRFWKSGCDVDSQIVSNGSADWLRCTRWYRLFVSFSIFLFFAACEFWKNHMRPTDNNRKENTEMSTTGVKVFNIFFKKKIWHQLIMHDTSLFLLIFGYFVVNWFSFQRTTSKANVLNFCFRLMWKWR